MKLYEELDFKFECTIGNREMKIIFFNAFSAAHRNNFAVQQKDYSKLSMDDFVTYFQLLHAQEAPHYKQLKCEAKVKLELKEENQETNATNECNAANKHNDSGHNDQPVPC